MKKTGISNQKLTCSLIFLVLFGGSKLIRPRTSKTIAIAVLLLIQWGRALMSSTTRLRKLINGSMTLITMKTWMMYSTMKNWEVLTRSAVQTRKKIMTSWEKALSILTLTIMDSLSQRALRSTRAGRSLWKPNQSALLWGIWKSREERAHQATWASLVRYPGQKSSCSRSQMISLQLVHSSTFCTRFSTHWASSSPLCSMIETRTWTRSKCWRWGRASPSSWWWSL